MKIERKSYEIKAATLEDNCLKGAASVVGVLDRSRDCIFPGAWDKTLKGFLANGFVAVGHAWSDLPVAMPVVAKASGNQLYTEAIFHSTTAAQDARTVCKERLAQNLSVGLSVGFMMDYGKEETPAYQYFETGQKLLDYAKANGYDLTLFDAKGIRACKSYCRGILNIEELLEYSIVPVPCNQDATASEAKSASGPGASPKDGADDRNAATILTRRDFEAYLRDAGYSRKDATAITNHGFDRGLEAGSEPGPAPEGELLEAGSEPTEIEPKAQAEPAATTEAETSQRDADNEITSAKALFLRTLNLRMTALHPR